MRHMIHGTSDTTGRGQLHQPLTGVSHCQRTMNYQPSEAMKIKLPNRVSHVAAHMTNYSYLKDTHVSTWLQVMLLKWLYCEDS